MYIGVNIYCIILLTEKLCRFLKRSKKYFLEFFIIFAFTIFYAIENK